MSTAATLEAPATKSQRDSLSNLGVLLGFTWKRNWVRSVVWLVIVVGMFVFIFDYYKALFTDESQLASFISTVDSPSLLAMVGIISNPISVVGATWCKFWMFGSLMLGIGVLFLMTRNLRGDEDQGRAELIRSTPLGIHSRLASSVILMSVLSIVIGILTGVALAALTSDPNNLQHLVNVSSVAAATQGSMVFGMSIAAMGLLGVGIGALTNEISPSSGAANGIGMAIFGVLYIIRMIGDVQSNAATWVSPIGWGQKMDPYGADRWWPFIMIVILAAILVWVAWMIQSSRDLGDSIAPQRKGKAGASALLTRVWGLGMRLQRGSFIAWIVCLVIFPMVLGSVIKAIRDMISGTTMAGLANMADTLDGVLGMIFIPMLALVVGIFAAQSATSLRTDEAHGVLESQLATGVGRVSWALQRLAVTFVAIVVFLLITGVCLGASYGALVSDMSRLPVVIGSFFAYLPACCLLASIFVLGFGWWPRYAVSVTWIVVVALWAFMIVGLALRIPTWLLDLMPFNATPAVPAVPMNWTPIIILSLIAAAFTVVGLIGFRRRNVPA
ncbi:MAG: hypothetical protein FWF43_03735 [Propionibacteriaceae bacterium]|nr:hypothetical protein [Propionibacteriaceae bacterium]